jgi:hypothetical protein
MRLSLLFITVIACGGKSTPAPEEPPPATSSLLSCKQIADHVAATVNASKPRTGVTAAAVQEMVSVRCSTDGWTDETKRCVFATKAISEARDCASTMTDEQRTAIKAHAARLRKDAVTQTDDNSSTDWISHVVEEPAAPAPRK